MNKAIRASAAALALAIASPAIAQTAAPTYLKGSQVTAADATVILDKTGVPLGTTTNPVAIYDPNTSTLVNSIYAPIPAQTTHGVNVGGIEGLTVAGTSGGYPVTVQGNTSGVPVPVSGTFWQATQPVSGTIGISGTPVVLPAANSGGAAPVVQSDNSAPINVSAAATTQVVALVAAKSIYVTSWDIVVAGADTITLEYGTGSNCGTGTTALTGTYNLAANGGLAAGSGLGVLFKLPAGNALCVVTGAATQAAGRVSYAQF